MTETPTTAAPRRVTYEKAPFPAVDARVPVVYRPDSAVFWLYTITLLLSTYLLLRDNGGPISMTMDAQIALAPIWIGFIVLLLWLMLRFDPFRSARRHPQGLLAGTALGGTTALVMAMNGNEALGAVWSRYLSPETMTAWSAALTAPFIEEAAKAMCVAVILVLCAAVFHRISHALLVGMFVGFGFDIVEDLTYATREAINSLDSDIAGAGPNLILRVITAVPAHWAYTALAAVGVLLLLPSFTGPPAWSYARRALLALPLMAAASFMHFVWDSPAPDGLDGVFLLGKLVVNLVVFLIPVLWLLRFERQWVAERIDQGKADATLAAVPEEILDSLLTGRARRRLRGRVRKLDGRRAKRAVRGQQNDALDLVQQSAQP